MYRVKIPSTPKPAAKSAPLAQSAPEFVPVAQLFTDSKAIFDNYHATSTFLKDCSAEMVAKINADDDIGSMYLLGLMHIDGKIAGYHPSAHLQDLAFGITLLERVIHKYDPASNDPLIAKFKPLAQASVFKLYELYSGKLADKSKTDNKKAVTCLEIAAFLGHTEATAILNAKNSKQYRM